MQSHEEVIEDLTMRYGTRDPFTLAERIGIRVLKCTLPEGCRSYYIVIGAVFWLFLNILLPSDAHKELVARAIGHHELHSTSAELDAAQKEEAARFAELLLSSTEARKT